MRSNSLKKTPYPHGFILKQDLNIAKLLLSKNRALLPIKTRTLDPFPFKSNLCYQIATPSLSSSPTLTKRNIKSAYGNPQHLFKVRYQRMKANLPNFSNLNYHFSYQTKGDFLLRFLDDDLNITSKRSKKFIYGNKDHYKDTKETKETRESNSRYNNNSSSNNTRSNASSNFGRTLSAFAKHPSVMLGSDSKFRNRNARPVSSNGWFETELKKGSLDI